MALLILFVCNKALNYPTFVPNMNSATAFTKRMPIYHRLLKRMSVSEIILKRGTKKPCDITPNFLVLLLIFRKISKETQ